MLHVRGVIQWLAISLTGVVIKRGTLRLIRPVGRMGDVVRVQTTNVLGRHSFVEASPDTDISWFASSSSVNETSAAALDAIGLMLLIVVYDSDDIDIRETLSRILEVKSSTRWFSSLFDKREGNLSGLTSLASNILVVISPSSLDTILLRWGVNSCEPCCSTKGLVDAMPHKVGATQLAALSSREKVRIKIRSRSNSSIL